MASDNHPLDCLPPLAASIRTSRRSRSVSSRGPGWESSACRRASIGHESHERVPCVRRRRDAIVRSFHDVDDDYPGLDRSPLCKHQRRPTSASDFGVRPGRTYNAARRGQRVGTARPFIPDGQTDEVGASTPVAVNTRLRDRRSSHAINSPTAGGRQRTLRTNSRRLRPAAMSAYEAWKMGRPKEHFISGRTR